MVDNFLFFGPRHSWLSGGKHVYCCNLLSPTAQEERHKEADRRKTRRDDGIWDQRGLSATAVVAADIMFGKNILQEMNVAIKAVSDPEVRKIRNAV